MLPLSLVSELDWIKSSLPWLCLKLPFHSQSIYELSKCCKKLPYFVFYNKCFSWKTVLSLKEKKHNIGVPTCKLPESTNSFLWLIR